MKVKEKFNKRIARIKEYKERATFYRCMKRNVAFLERRITAYVNADTIDYTYVCIKRCNANSPQIDVSEIGDDSCPNTKYCYRFNNESPCRMHNCSCYKNNNEYIKEKQLLNQVKMGKETAFRQIFEKIK